MIGITQYAVEALGDVVFIDLPKAGSDVNKQGKVNRDFASECNHADDTIWSI